MNSIAYTKTSEGQVLDQDQGHQDTMANNRQLKQLNPLKLINSGYKNVTQFNKDIHKMKL